MGAAAAASTAGAAAADVCQLLGRNEGAQRSQATSHKARASRSCLLQTSRKRGSWQQAGSQEGSACLARAKYVDEGQLLGWQQSCSRLLRHAGAVCPTQMFCIECSHPDHAQQQRSLMKLPLRRAAATASWLGQHSRGRVELQGGVCGLGPHCLLQELQVCGCKAGI